MTVKYIQVHMSTMDREEGQEAERTSEEENVFVCMRGRERETSYWQRHLLHRANMKE